MLNAIDTSRTARLRRAVLIAIMVGVSFGGMLMGAGPAAHAADVFWTNPSSGPWDNGINWDQFFVPESGLDEVAIINNGGTATILASVPNAAGLVIGQDVADSGTVSIGSAGSLQLVNTGGFANTAAPDGSAQIGIAGSGVLNIDGGSLTSVSLNVGVNGVASFRGSSTTVTGDVQVDGAFQTFGATASFFASSYSLSGTGQHIVEIAGPASPEVIDVAGVVDLNGTITLDFSGSAPSNADAWVLFDAGSITGTPTASAIGLTPGLDLSFETVSGGSNGSLLRAVVVSDVITGDYNGDGFVSQADLDLVLLNWGDAIAPGGFDETALPGGGPFDGLISQNELDGVLLNWGAGTVPGTNAIPEPISASLLTVTTLGLTLRRH